MKELRVSFHFGSQKEYRYLSKVSISNMIFIQFMQILLRKDETIYVYIYIYMQRLLRCNGIISHNKDINFNSTANFELDRIKIYIKINT